MATRKTLYVDANGDYIESAGMYETSDFINTSSGAGDAGKPVVLNADGKIDPTMVSFNSLSWKEPVRVASTANTSLASAVASIDGVALSNGDRVLIKDQAAPEQNGIYVFNGAGSAFTRAEDANASSEVVAGMVVVVTEGVTHADKTFVLTTDNPITLDTTGLTFAPLPVNTFSGGNGIDINASNIISVDHDGQGLTFSVNQLSLELDGATLSKSASGVKVADLGIDTAQLADDSVTAAKLNADTAGLGLSQAVGGELDVNVDDSTIEINVDTLQVKADGINDTHIDFGTGVNQVSAVDLPIADTNGNYTATEVEGALAEIAEKLVDRDTATAGEAITVGDVLYFSANNTVSIYSDISVSQRAVGIALESASAAAEVAYARWDEVATGALTGATFGTRYYWDGSALTTSIPGTSGQYVWQAGIAKNATDLLITLEFVKKNV